jgi:two-component system sensor histidine kinase KdpD
MEYRPNPDELLARVQAEDSRRSRGQLKIFFGASAGVGKTYAMLQAAHERRAEGIDLAVGYVETHGRVETAALLDGLELLPRRLVEYRGALLEEFDIDAALARAPALLLIDEVAHSNAPGSRHPKRWQDVEELLAAGIDVYTTVNVQHIESLNDVVAQITGVLVRETVPDHIVERADEVELIDLTPDDLLQRLREGKVYVPAQAERALQGFFRKGNLIALRELALRRTAERVDAQMRGYMREHAIPATWPAAERILVCVGAEPSGPRLIRAARRIAVGLHAEWIAVTVETPRQSRQSEADRDRIVQTVRLAEQLGAEAVTLSGPKISQVLLNYARTRNVTKIVVGKPSGPRWQELLHGSTVDELVRHSGEIDVYVITGDREDGAAASPRLLAEPTSDLGAYGWALLTVLIATVLAWLMFPVFALANLIMVYLLGVVVMAARGGRGRAILVSLLSVATFDFFFVPPFYTFAVSDVEYLVTFAVMLLIGLLISTLTVRLRHQADSALARERRVAALYAMSREFARKMRIEDLLRVIVQHVGQTFESKVVVLLPTRQRRLQPWGEVAGWWTGEVGDRAIFAPDAHEQGVAQWVFEHGQMAGQGTDTLAGAQALYLPLIGARGPIGVLGVQPAHSRRFLAPEQLRLVETFASQAALSLERVELADDAQRAQVRAETEQLRSSLLSSVSHDLRTPLAVITGALSSLAGGAPALDDAARDELIGTASGEAERLNRLVGNLLDMTRVESGGMQARKEWQPIEEVIGAALARLDDRLRGREVTIDIAPDLPLVPLDSVLIEQVLINLLENALKYAPADSPLALRAALSDGAVTIEVADRGPGLANGDEGRIFDKFYRAPSAQGQPGAGLGLAIAKGMVAAHGGRIWAENRFGGGAVFRFTLPLEGRPPAIVPEALMPGVARG